MEPFEKFPLVLAGPILRRCEPTRICVWLATSRPVSIDGFVWRGEDAQENGRHPGVDIAIGSASVDCITIARQLFLVLVEMTPMSSSGTFPRGEILAYDLMISENSRSGQRPAPPTWLTKLVQGIQIRPWSLPTLVLQSDGASLNLLHTSCRKLHGKADDAMTLVGDAIQRLADQVSKRPTALILTGDQIYADDVADEIAPHIYKLAINLIGGTEAIAWEGKRVPLTELAGLRYIVAGTVLSPDDKSKKYESTGRNHLFGFGEFAMMYLLAWNEGMWPAGALSDSLERLRTGIPKVRLALANIPTYMLCDDHEITDDWNIDREWVERTQTKGPARATSRRIIANGLAAYWAFQAWGDDPKTFPSSRFADVIRRYLEREVTASTPYRLIDSSDFENVFLSTTAGSSAGSKNDVHWEFVVPTDPPTVVLDSRTRRSFPDDQEGRGPAALLDEAGLEALDNTLRALKTRSPHIVVVAATPVFGVWLVEKLIEAASSYDVNLFDRETWHGNKKCFEGLLSTIQRNLRGTCVFLSGDLHYAFAIHAAYRSTAGTTQFVQFTSSAAKNPPERGAKLVLEKVFGVQRWTPEALLRLTSPRNEKLSTGSVLSVLIPLLGESARPIWEHSNIGALRVVDDSVTMTFIQGTQKTWSVKVKTGADPRSSNTGAYATPDP